MNDLDMFLYFVGIGIIITLIIGYVKRCKSCKEWWVRKFLHRNLIDERDGYKTVTRYDYIKDNSGKIVNTIERREQVHVTYSTYENYYYCKKCNHKWTTISEVERTI